MNPVSVKPKRVPSPEELRADQFGFKPDEEEPMPAYENKGLADKAFEVIRRHEGFRAKPYLDTNKNWTVGIGTLIGKGTDADLKASPFFGKEIDESTAKDLATKAIAEKITLAKRLVGPNTFSDWLRGSLGPTRSAISRRNFRRNWFLEHIGETLLARPKL